jgi:hypothetical protein
MDEAERRRNLLRDAGLEGVLSDEELAMPLD